MKFETASKLDLHKKGCKQPTKVEVKADQVPVKVNPDPGVKIDQVPSIEQVPKVDQAPDVEQVPEEGIHDITDEGIGKKIDFNSLSL